jgi:hypothetical protein
MFFDALDKGRIREILEVYGDRICLPPSAASELADKRYCSLIFIDNVRAIEPFDIDKTGYGNMAAWITIDDIEKIRR